MSGGPLGSVVIPAHNEAAVIERCLDNLFSYGDAGDLEVVVVCNGCDDDTAARARSSGHPVQVLELAQPSKSAALRAGEIAVTTLPRLYLDADVVLPGRSARRVLERLHGAAVAARPPIQFNTSRASRPVRRYYRARSRVPGLMTALWGAGVCGLSADGRGRFGTFPDVVADDLWLDRHFAAAEIEIVVCPPVVVEVPRRTTDLIRILRRTYRGNAEVRRGEAGGLVRCRATTASTLRDLGRLVLDGRVPAIDAFAFAGFAVMGRLAVAVAPALDASTRWERDERSRRP
jgi:glycosyltransferase involved in cell wall biosynthesis